MSALIRRHLGIKIFISYLAVILVGVIVLLSASEFSVPSAFDRHMADMQTMMNTGMGGAMMDTDLFTSFRFAVNEALVIGTLASMLAAILVSLFVARQVVAPVRAMMLASQRIAEGHYDERVQVKARGEMLETDELDQLALSFNRMADTLEKIEAMRRQLIADVTHELRTPLTSIKGYMEGLMDGVLAADLDTFKAVYQEADRLTRLVDDLQEISRVEAGAYTLNPRPITVAALASVLVDRLGRQFEEKGVGLAVDISPDLPPVLADEDRIGQVLLNLVGNALQYTPPGGRVRLSARLENRQVHVSISDTGMGIAPEHLAHIFTRFYRADKSRSRPGGGSGIGLTIAKHLVEAHGGRIWARSPGTHQGSNFTFTLPAASKTDKSTVL